MISVNHIIKYKSLSNTSLFASFDLFRLSLKNIKNVHSCNFEEHPIGQSGIRGTLHTLRRSGLVRRSPQVFLFSWFENSCFPTLNLIYALWLELRVSFSKGWLLLWLEDFKNFVDPLTQSILICWNRILIFNCFLKSTLTFCKFSPLWWKLL